MPAARPLRVPRWLDVVAVALLAAVALLVVGFDARPAGESALTVDEVALVLVLVTALLPRAEIPMRHRLRLGSADGTSASLVAWTFVPVSALPLAVAVAGAAGSGPAAVLAVIAGTLAAECAALAVRAGRGPQWWRVPVVVTARGLLAVAIVAVSAGLAPASPALLALVPIATVLDLALTAVAAMIVRRLAHWPAGGWPLTWGAATGGLLTGVGLAVAWLVADALSPMVAVGAILLAWLACVLGLAWLRDIEVRRALREIETSARGLADLVERGDITAGASRDAYLVLAAHGLAMATGAWTAEIALRARAGADAAICMDRCPLAQPRVIALRADAPARALAQSLPAQDPFARAEVTCWDAFGTPVRLDRYAGPIADMLAASLADGRRAVALARALHDSFAEHVDAGTAVVPVAALPEAFERLADEALGDGTLLAVLVARLVDASRSGRWEHVPPDSAGRITRLLVRRLVASEGHEDLSFVACRAGAGRVILLVGAVTDVAQVDALIAQASAMDTTVVSEDGVTSLTLAVGGAVLERDGSSLDELVTAADRRSIGELVTPSPDPWVPLAVALAQRSQVPVAPWMLAPGSFDSFVAALEAEGDRSREVLLVPVARPASVAPGCIERLAELGAGIGLPLAQVAADHPLRPLMRAVIVDPDAPGSSALAALAIGRAAGVPVLPAT